MVFWSQAEHSLGECEDGQGELHVSVAVGSDVTSTSTGHPYYLTRTDILPCRVINYGVKDYKFI